MVKIYHSYSLLKPSQQYTSGHSNIQYLNINKQNNQILYLVTGVNQYIAIISIKTGLVLKYLHPQKDRNRNELIKYIVVDDRKIYGGYQDGVIICYNIINNQLDYQIQFVIDHHKSSISYILSSSSIQEQESLQLITGSTSGDIAICQILSEEAEIIKSAHKGNVTQLALTRLMVNSIMKLCLISIGKDGYLKIWDTTNLLCLGLVALGGQALSMYVDNIRNIVYVGLDREDIYIIKIGNSSQISSKFCQTVGIIKRNNHSRCLQMIEEYNMLYLLNSDKGIQIYQILTDPQIEKKKNRINQRKKQKINKLNQQQKQHKQQQKQINIYELTLKFLTSKNILHRCFNFLIISKNIYVNTGINIYKIKIQQSQTNTQNLSITQITHSVGKTLQLQLQNPFLSHRSNKQCIIYSTSSVLSQNKPSQKLFSIVKDQQIKWSMIFNQGYIMIITTTHVSIYDLAKNQEIYRLQEVWSGCWVKGNNCLLWNNNKLNRYQIGYNKNKQIQMKKISNKHFQQKINQASFYNQSTDKYIVNLQNSTIQINYVDTHKTFLVLHGHKLPILTYSISSDDNILATGSVDKDIRLWDLQFGHCIKTLFAHKSPVTVTRFINQTHFLFTGGRDGLIKMWDMDTFQLILQLNQGQAEIKDISITRNSQFIIAGGIDTGFRIWQKSADQIVAGQQQQKNKQKYLIQDYTMQKIRKQQKLNQQANQNYIAQKIRYDDLKYGQQIIQALENNQHPKNLIIMLKKISPNNLKSSLSFLHKKHILKLQNYLQLIIKQNYQLQLCYRVLQALYGTPNKQKKQIIQFNQQNSNIMKIGQQMRNKWQKILHMLRINKQLFNLLDRSFKENKRI